MWGWAKAPGVLGYCGETTMQSAGLYFGNYVSSEHVFRANGGITPLWRNYDNRSLGVGGVARGETVLLSSTENYEFTATALGLTIKPFNDVTTSKPQSPTFLSFVQAAIDQGHFVAGGVYMPTGDDPVYDHIVPIIGYEADSNGNITALYYNDLKFVRTNRIMNFLQTRAACQGAYNGRSVSHSLLH
jgi:hypothetical protein